MGKISIGCANCGADYPFVSSQLEGELRVLVERRCPLCSEEPQKHTPKVPKCIKANCVGSVAGRSVALVGGTLFYLENGAWKVPGSIAIGWWGRLAAPELHMDMDERARLVCCDPARLIHATRVTVHWDHGGGLSRR
jgi:hypothetical protein